MALSESAMGFRFFDHTGDIGVDLEAPTLGGLFAAAAEAFTATLTELDTVQPRETHPVTLAAPSADLLLVEWLSELLYRFDVHRWLARSADLKVSPTGDRVQLEGSVTGEPFDPTRHPIHVLVKAVTYHGLHVTPTENGWTARVIFDI